MPSAPIANDEMAAAPARVERIDFSAITDDIAIDLQTAMELYMPAYAMLPADRDFWRASNSLQLDDTVGLYAARPTGEKKHLAMISNRHPLVPHSTLRAGFRLMLHGLSTEVLHGFLGELKAKAAAAPARACDPLEADRML